MNVLFAEDNFLTSEAVSGYLADAGHTVTPVPCGQKCLDMLRSKKWDVLLLDLELPGPSGFQILREIFASSELSPPLVIVETGFDADDVRRVSPNHVHVLIKPFKPEDLLALLES